MLVTIEDLRPREPTIWPRWAGVHCPRRILDLAIDANEASVAAVQGPLGTTCAAYQRQASKAQAVWQLIAPNLIETR